MADPQPKAEIGENFRKQLGQLADYAAAQAEAVLNGTPAPWYRPAGFNDAFSTSDAFRRDEQERHFEQAVIDPENPGTVGDLALAQLQGDTLAAMERAFRARHHSAVRDRLHAAARLRGHGHAYGAIRNGMLGYIVNLDQRNKS